MPDLFDNALHHLGQNYGKEILALNIGSMDGVMFDELYAYKSLYGFQGLFVEPIPYHFEALKRNIGTENNDLFENSAISDYDGEIDMLMIDRDAIDQGLVNQCFYGMSACWPPKNGLGSQGDKETVEKYGRMIRVPCLTFESLLKKHQIDKFDIVKIDAEGHDYKIFKQIDLNKYKPKVIRIEWISLSDSEQRELIELFDSVGYRYQVLEQDICAVSDTLINQMAKLQSKSKQSDEKNPLTLTLVTGLWDIGRSDLSEGWSRTYTDYLQKFSQLLVTDVNMIIYGDNELEKFVSERRNPKNTHFIHRTLDWFKQNDYYEKIQKIRCDEKWLNQTGWLRDSPQAKLSMYDPIVMSKMFLLNDARICDIFNSDLMFWIDAGLTNTVHPGYFTHDKVLEKLQKYIQKFTFVMFPYEAVSEIHGFEYNKLCEYAGTQNVCKVARGGFFGGPVKRIAQMNIIYYDLLIKSLCNGLLGTEESIFTIIAYSLPGITDYAEIGSDGMMWKFFEDLKDGMLEIKSN